MRHSSELRWLLGQPVSKRRVIHGKSYIREVLVDAPTSFYPCQDASGTKPVDTSGGANNMVTQAGVPWWRSDGPFNYGADPLRKAPDDQRIRGDYAISQPQFRRNTTTSAVNNWALECWVMEQGAFSDVGIIMGNGDGLFSGGASVGYDLFWSGTAGKFQCGYRGVAVNSDSAISCVSDVWYHIVVTRDAGTLKYYVNGASDTANAGTGAPASPAGTQIRFGSSAVSQKIAYPAFYGGGALSAARVAAHYGAMEAGL